MWCCGCLILRSQYELGVRVLIHLKSVQRYSAPIQIHPSPSNENSATIFDVGSLTYECHSSNLRSCKMRCSVSLLETQTVTAPNDTAYKRWSCHSGLKLLCKLCRTSPPPAMGVRFTVFWACRPCGPAGWLALLLTKAGDVETNPGPTTSNKKVWICDICHKQIHVRSRYP